LVEPKSGKKFATGPTDWKMWHEKVPEKLKELHKDGYGVIFPFFFIIIIFSW
jgi:hypothetical protein